MHESHTHMDSPDLLPPPIISEFVATPANPCDERAVRRGRKRRDSSWSKPNPPAKQTTANRDYSEEFVDEEKHSRAMQILYHLQQRQEQVAALLDDRAASNASLIDDELRAVKEVLCRLLRVFRVSKDELNNSQCFPKDPAGNSSLARKQLLINTRLNKCNNLLKVQQDLEERFAQVRDLLDSSEPAADGGWEESSRLEDRLALEKSVLDLENSFLSSSDLAPPPLPFQHPIYSRDGQCGSTSPQQRAGLPEDMLGGDPLTNHRQPPTQLVSLPGTIIGFHGRKMFSSPPRQHTISALPEQPGRGAADKASALPAGQGRSRDQSIDGDVSQVFEPSQQLLFQHPEPLLVQPPVSPVSRVDRGTSTSDVENQLSGADNPHKPECSSARPWYRQLKLGSQLRVRIIDDSQLTALDDEPLIKELFCDQNNNTISTQLYHMIERLMT